MKSTYKKGDTIDLKDERIVLILNDGIKGHKFVAQYSGQVILYFFSSSIINIFKRAGTRIVGDYWWHVPNDDTKEEIWYYILIGDQQGWIEERRLK